MAETLQSSVAEPLLQIEVEEQLIQEEFFMHHEVNSIVSESDNSSEENNENEATMESYQEPREIDVEEVRVVKEFSTATCKCQKKKGGHQAY